jgi:hypothetical protein
MQSRDHWSRFSKQVQSRDHWSRFPKQVQSRDHWSRFPKQVQSRDHWSRFMHYKQDISRISSKAAINRDQWSRLCMMTHAPRPMVAALHGLYFATARF